MADLNTATPVFIAEAGVNHNGEEALAIRLIDAAADAGADWVKFQTFRTQDLVSDWAPKAEYQKPTSDGGDSQFEMLKKLELSFDAQRRLLDHADKRGIRFLSTPFDLGSLDFLVSELSLDAIKLGSGDLTNAPLLLAIAKTGKPLYLSTGMSDIPTIEQALGVLAFGYLTRGESEPRTENFTQAFRSAAGKAALVEHVTLLHCLSSYPAPIEDLDLLAIPLLREHFDLPIGYSDHADGIVPAVAACALGASVIEKHLTLDRGMAGPDHHVSLEPDGFAEMVAACRTAARALGQRRKSVKPCEVNVREVARKSLFSSAAIKRGEPFSVSNLTVKRPGSGIDASQYFDWIGRAADRDYQPGEMIDD